MERKTSNRPQTTRQPLLTSLTNIHNIFLIMPAQRRQTGITKKGLQYTVMSVHCRNALKKKIETENPIPTLFKEFE
jgi:hypothetical protein